MKALSLFAIALLFWGCNLPKQEASLTPLIVGVPPPNSIAINILDYAPQPGNILRNLFVSNFSVSVSKGKVEFSSAMDGLSDALKEGELQSFNFDLNSAYTGTLGINNLLLYLTGIPPAVGPTLCSSAAQPAANCSTLQKNYAYNCANDGFYFMSPLDQVTPVFLGMSDCEKRFIKLDFNRFDTNGNGVPDVLKLRCGMNPNSDADGQVNIANDSYSNIEKCKRHLPHDESADLPLNLAYAYQYEFSLNTDGTHLVTISNISILNGGINNFIALYIVEYVPATGQEVLSSAFLILNDTFDITQPINVQYWGLNTNVQLSM